MVPCLVLDGGYGWLMVPNQSDGRQTGDGTTARTVLAHQRDGAFTPRSVVQTGDGNAACVNSVLPDRREPRPAQLARKAVKFQRHELLPDTN